MLTEGLRQGPLEASGPVQKLEGFRAADPHELGSLGKHALWVFVCMSCMWNYSTIQRGASDHSHCFEKKNLGNSPNLLKQYVATVAAHQPGELPKYSSSKPSERSEATDCIYLTLSPLLAEKLCDKKKDCLKKTTSQQRLPRAVVRPAVRHAPHGHAGRQHQQLQDPRLEHGHLAEVRRYSYSRADSTLELS